MLRSNHAVLSTITLLALTAIFCVVAFQAGLTEQHRLDDVRLKSVSADGVVVSRRADASSPLNQRINFSVTYRFTAQDGKSVYTREQNVPLEGYIHLKEGTRILVSYLPEDPSIVTLTAPYLDNSRALIAYIVTVVGGAGLLVVLVYLIPMTYRFWRGARLMLYGQVLDATVLCCHRTYPASLLNTSTNGEALQETPFYVELRCKFRAGDGKELRAETVQLRPDLRDVPLPTFGVRAAVLYLNRNNYKIL